VLGEASLENCYQLYNGIATDNGLKMVVMDLSDQAETDSSERAADFAMVNSMVSEDSQFLFGSLLPEHHLKGFMLELKGLFDGLDTPRAQAEFAARMRPQIAEAHGCEPRDVVIYGLSRGSVKFHYGINPARLSPPGGLINREWLSGQLSRKLGGEYIDVNAYPAFRQMGLNPRSFDIRWNRDFRAPGSAGWDQPQNESRGGAPYYVPRGFYRVAQAVSQKFRDGGKPDDTWLGMSNGAGEWRVGGHGTRQGLFENTNYDSVKAILGPGPGSGATQSAAGGFLVGTNNGYGFGVYFAPNVATCVKDNYARVCVVQGKKYRYAFMVRVNGWNIHRCQTTKCYATHSDDGQPYTLHYTTNPEYDFAVATAPVPGQPSINIRSYGVLVQEA
jgi:hypothetical protein